MIISAFWIGRFIFDWTIWLIFADKSRWREILPICFFATNLALTLDLYMEVNKLWEFLPGKFFAAMVNAWGIYAVSTYLFIQYLPEKKTFLHMFKYWFFWTAITAIFEIVHIWTGHMVYIKWNLGFSYLADWILFWLFYKFYVVIRCKPNHKELE